MRSARSSAPTTSAPASVASAAKSPWETLLLARHRQSQTVGQPSPLHLIGLTRIDTQSDRYINCLVKLADAISLTVPKLLLGHKLLSSESSLASLYFFPLIGVAFQLPLLCAFIGRGLPNGRFLRP